MKYKNALKLSSDDGCYMIEFIADPEILYTHSHHAPPKKKLELFENTFMVNVIVIFFFSLLLNACMHELQPNTVAKIKSLYILSSNTLPTFLNICVSFILFVLLVFEQPTILLILQTRNPKSFNILSPQTPHLNSTRTQPTQTPTTT